MAEMASLDKTQLRTLTCLDPTVYLAFRNCRAANMQGERLEGFDPKRHFKNLPLLDRDSSDGWFWRGESLLGTDHWRASFLRFVERLEAADLFQDGIGEELQVNAQQQLLHRIIDEAHNGTDPALRPPVPKRNESDIEPHFVDSWSATLLSEFARASRYCAAERYVRTIESHANMPMDKVLAGVGMLLRLAPELFAFYLLIWEIAREKP